MHIRGTNDQYLLSTYFVPTFLPFCTLVLLSSIHCSFLLCKCPLTDLPSLDDPSRLYLFLLRLPLVIYNKPITVFNYVLFTQLYS